MAVVPFDPSQANKFAEGALSNLNGLFKEVYAKKLEHLVPDGVQLLNMIPFSQKEAQPGNKYHQPVILGLEHGVTFAEDSEDAFQLNEAMPGVTKDASVRGAALVLRSALGYKAVSSSMSGAQAFESATKYLVGNMLRSITKKLEIELLYGQMGYAKLEASGPSTDVVIQAKEWAPGIWAGAEGMPIEIFVGDTATLNAAAKVVSVDFDTKTLTLDTTVTVAAGDTIYHKGAKGKEFAGIHKIITNTGELFGIDASAYSMWKGNTYDAGGGVLSFNRLQEAVARAVSKGLETKVTVLVNPDTWADLLNDQASKRMFDSSHNSSKLENGAKGIRFHSQNGEMEIMPSIYIKAGFAYVLCLDEMVRVGSSEVTFKRPGRSEEFFRELENHAGYELRVYTDQALFCHAPARNVVITNITNGGV